MYAAMPLSRWCDASLTSPPRPPLTAAEIQAHPEFPHVHWQLKPDKRERIDVAAGRGGPFKIAYEIHGHGPRKIIVSIAIRDTAAVCCPSIHVIVVHQTPSLSFRPG